jgi:hypothetical protein
MNRYILKMEPFTECSFFLFPSVFGIFIYWLPVASEGDVYAGFSSCARHEGHSTSFKISSLIVHNPNLASLEQYLDFV